MDALQVYALLCKQGKKSASGIKSHSVSGTKLTITFADDTQETIDFGQLGTRLEAVENGLNGKSLLEVGD